MNSPIWLKLTVSAWLVLSFGIIWIAYEQEMSPYLGQDDAEYLESKFVERKWQEWREVLSLHLSQRRTVRHSTGIQRLSANYVPSSNEGFSIKSVTSNKYSEGDIAEVEVFHFFSSNCACNRGPERHIQSLSSLPNVKVHRINIQDLPIKLPASPTLIVQVNQKLKYFGAYGDGPLCRNDVLTDWIAELASSTNSNSAAAEAPLLLNTMVKGCFCHQV